MEKYVFVEAFQLLLSMGKHRHAVQLLQYHVPPDSLRLARMLLECERTHDKSDQVTRQALVQAAMDMMMRLRAYHDLVVELLKRYRLMTAMRVVLRHRERFAMETSWTRRGSMPSSTFAASSSAPPLSTLEQGVPKEAFFRTAVAQLRESVQQQKDKELLRINKNKRNQKKRNGDAKENGDGGDGGDGKERKDEQEDEDDDDDDMEQSDDNNSHHKTGGKLETFHAVYAFYRELWPHLLQPILKEASSTSTNDDPISPLAASTSFPDDLFDDFRVADMYRSLFGFNHSGRE